MADLTRLNMFLNGVDRGFDLTSYSPVVASLKITGGTIYELTNAILGRLINVQSGTDLDTSYHTHNTIYTQIANLASRTSGKGASLVGLQDAGNYFGGTSETVEGAMQQVGANVANLITLTGVAANAVNLGSFTAGIIPANTTIKPALQSLETAVSILQSVSSQFTWLNAVINVLNTPPGSPSTGDRYLVGTSPTGAWVGHANAIAQWGGSSWVFTVPALGDYLAVESMTNVLYYWGGSSWMQQAFENTTASTGLVKVGTDIQLANVNTNGLQIASGVITVNVDGSTITRGAGTGNPLQVGTITESNITAGTITNASISATAGIALTKLAALSTNLVLVSNGSGFISASSVTTSQLQQLTNGSSADSLHTHAIDTDTFIAGQTFNANTTYAVRLAVSTDGNPNANTVYAADNGAATADLFYVIGIVRVGGSAITAGNNVTVIKFGPLTVGASDFTTAQLGLPIFLGTAGGLLVGGSNAPSSTNTAVVRVGYVRNVNQIEVSPQVMYVN